MQRFRHIGIAGAGLLGRLLAWRLSRFGIRVELFDSDTVDGIRSCAHIAGGMLAPFSELIDCDGDVAKLGIDSLALWTSWAAELEMGVFQEQFGTLMVVHNRDRSELHHFYRRVSDKIARSNFPNSIEYLDSQRILEMEPDLPEYFSEGVYMPLEGHIDSRQLMLSLKHELERLDVLWHSDVKIDTVVDSRLMGENIDRRFDFVVDCRGTGARASLNALRTVRGESILLHAPEVSLKRPIRMLHPRFPLYVVPREHNHYLIGATQIESDDLSPISVQAVLELLSSAVLLHPGFKDSRIVTLGANCRPAFFDNRPKIIVRSGSMFINGLFRHGFMCAPAILSECVSFLESGQFSEAFSQSFVLNEN